VPTLGEQWHVQIDAGVAGLRVAVLDEPGFPVPPDAEGGCSVAAAAAHLAAAGASVEQARVGVSDLRPFFGANWIMSLAALVRSLSGGQRRQVEPDLLRLVALRADPTAVEILAMEQERLRSAHLMATFHVGYDLVLCPAVPGGPPLADAKLHDIEDVFWNVWAAWTPLFNASRQPAVSVPCGIGRDGLPRS